MNKKNKAVIDQAKKLIRYNNQGSYGTKRRYAESYLRFCNFMADEFNVQNIKNTQPKHLNAYVEDMKSRDLSIAHIKTELSGIRAFHSKIDNARYKSLPSNESLNLERRSYKDIDRKWTQQEIDNFKQICIEEDKEWIVDAIDIARGTGFRISEVIKIDREDLERALEEGVIHTVGKGGLERYVPYEEDLKPVFERLINQTEKYSKVFVDENRKAHNVHREIQRIIRENRDQITVQNGLNKPPLTFHGLRHSYANQKFIEASERAESTLEAELKVSKLLGHGRPEVTRTYTV